jgi:hypothetical protein
MNSPKSPSVRLLLLAISIGLLAVGVPPVAGQTVGEPIKSIDENQVQSGGIRKLVSKHLQLYTDVPSSPEVGRLPQIFDDAVPQWAAYFGIDLAKTANWQARAYLIGDSRRFEALGLMPPGHPKFTNGISMGAELWFHDQPTPYYRRHLLLHEGTHVFMASFLGGCGPGWYMEGTAELFGTHRLDETTGRLELRIMPNSREEVPMLGRIKLIRDAIADKRTLSLPTIMQFDNSKQLGNEAYAWCWAAAKFLDTHPRYRDRFRSLSKRVLDPNFNDLVRRNFAADWIELSAEWEAYIAALDHDFDFDRMAINFRGGKPLSGLQRVEIAADRGWQSSGVWLEANKSYKLTAAGRYQIAAEGDPGSSKPWPCEPGGITIEYHDGHPLGMLLGALHQDGERASNDSLSFAEPLPIGLEATIKPVTSGTLYFRVNDSAARLDDNRGSLTVSIEEAPNAER